MSIFGSDNHRYPSVPELLRPKPGGLRNDQLLVYDVFQRMPRQPVVPATQTTENVEPSGGAVGSPSGSIRSNTASSPRLTGSDGMNPFKLQPGDMHLSTNSLHGTRPQVWLENISTIAGKIDSAVTSLLSSAGARASEITLSMLPPENEIKQLLMVVQQVAELATSNGNEGGRRLLSST